MSEIERLTQIFDGCTIRLPDKHSGVMLETSADSIIRAVLHAIREPSEDMLSMFSFHEREKATRTWQAMIDLLLLE